MVAVRKNATTTTTTTTTTAMRRLLVTSTPRLTRILMVALGLFCVTATWYVKFGTVDHNSSSRTRAATTAVDAPPQLHVRSARAVHEESTPTQPTQPANDHGRAGRDVDADLEAAAAAAAAAAERTKAAEIAATEAATVAASTLAPTPTNKEFPVFFGDDVVLIIMTHSQRHSWMRLIRRTWGRFVKRLFIFSDTDDPSVPTIQLKSPFPNMHDRDRRQTWYPNAVVPVLMELSKTLDPPPKFFINLDDDTFPLLDMMQQWLQGYQRRRGTDRYPYIVSAGKSWTTVDEKAFEYREQVTSGMQFFKPDKRVPFMPGHMYGFNVDYLNDIAPHVMNCPLLRPSDINMGGLLMCSEMARIKSRTNDNIDRTINWTDWVGSRVGILDPSHSYNETTTEHEWRRFIYYHHNRPYKTIMRAYELYYENILDLAIADFFPNKEDKREGAA